MRQATTGDELKKLLAQLKQMVDQLAHLMPSADLLPSRGETDPAYLVDALYAERRLRDQIFLEPHLFGEPAWDILLDVAAADSQKNCLSVTDACVGSCVPPTTALRYIAELERCGLVRREPDPLDSRRKFLHLTAGGRSRVKRYLAAVLARRRGQGQLV